MSWIFFEVFPNLDLLAPNVGVISISQSRVGIKLFHVTSLKLFRKLSGAERREQERSMQRELLATGPFNAFWAVRRNDISSQKLVSKSNFPADAATSD